MRHTSSGKKVAPCPHCQRGKLSYGEVELYDFCKTLDAEAKIGDRAILSGKEIDILLPSFLVGIEYNGVYWHSDEVILGKYGITAEEYHTIKKEAAAAKGYALYFVWSSDWVHEQATVKNAIRILIETGVEDPLLTKLSLPREEVTKRAY